jgi:predicted ATP-grasp superfamily ATP-dependent carboligase
MKIEEVCPLFYADGQTIFRRPVENEAETTLGFRVCEVDKYVDPDMVALYLNVAVKALKRAPIITVQ